MTSPDGRSASDAFGHLDPGRVLDALAAVGLDGDGRVLTLNSYENRVFLVHLDGGQAVVAKFYRPGRWTDEQILEEHAFAAELAEAEVPVVPPLHLEARATPGGRCEPLGVTSDGGGTLFRFEADAAADRFAESPRRAGRSPELEEHGVLTWIGRFIARLHAVGARRAFVHRRTLSVASFGEDSVAALLEGRFVADEARAAWTTAADRCLQAVRQAFEAAGHCPTIRLHGDCHVGNILWTGAGPHFVDLDDAVNGPAAQDLWMLLSGDRLARIAQMAEVLEGYEAIRPFPPGERHLLEALRALRILHYSAWIARRWHDPAFPAAFPWFGTPAYWSDQATRLREQVEAIEDGPLPRPGFG